MIGRIDSQAAVTIPPGPVSSSRVPPTTVLPLVVLLTAASLVPRAAGAAAIGQAEDSPEVGKIALLNRTAMEEYQNLNFDEAQRQLKEALELATKSGLSQHPIRARTYLNLGIVTLVGLRQRAEAIRDFRKALQIDPEIKLNRAYVSPDIREAFDEAVQGLTSQSSDIPSEELLLHDPVSTGVRGQPITVAAFPKEELAMATLVLLYRPAGMLGYSEVRMQRKGSGAFDGTIPAEATGAAEVGYYIEARRADGKAIASRGSPERPFVIRLAGSGIASPPPPPGGAATAKPSGPKLYFALMIGSGVGRVSGGTAEQTRAPIDTPGFLWARVGHLAPEIGFWATPEVLLSLQGRIQLVTGTNDYHIPDPMSGECGDGVCSPAKGAVAAFAKVAWFFLGRDKPLQPFASLSVGGGQIRHVITLDLHDCGTSGTDACVDTVAAGPFLVGPALGLNYAFNDSVALSVALQSLVGAPNFVINADLNLGLAFQF